MTRLQIRLSSLTRIFYTGSLTFAEFCAKPKKNKGFFIIEKCKIKIYEFNFVVFELASGIAEFSADLRAKYPFRKRLDGNPLASTISLGCNNVFYQ